MAMSVLGVALANVQVAPNAAAADATCGAIQPTNRFDGYYYDVAAHTAYYEGASAYIDNGIALTCNSVNSSPSPTANSIGTNFTTSWVMIADYDGTSWSQVGVIAGWNDVPYDWAEVVLGYNKGPGGTTPIERFDRFYKGANSPRIPLDTKQAFYEQWLEDCPFFGVPCETSKVGATVITDTDFDPFDQYYWTNGSGPAPEWVPQYSGEKLRSGTDIMGTPSDHTNFTSIGVQRFSDDVFELDPCDLTLKVNATRAHEKAFGCNSFDIWTDPST